MQMSAFILQKLAQYRWNRGLQAIRDSHVLALGSFHLLQTYFKTEEFYDGLVAMMLEATHRTNIGLTQIELIRPSLIPPGTPKPMELLKAGKEFAYGSFLPYGAVMMAMIIINGVKVPELMATMEEIGFEAGLICAISEDYLDCYGDTIFVSYKHFLKIS